MDNKSKTESGIDGILTKLENEEDLTAKTAELQAKIKEQRQKREEAERPLKSRVTQPHVFPSGNFMPPPRGPSQASDFYFPSSQQPHTTPVNHPEIEQLRRYWQYKGAVKNAVAASMPPAPQPQKTSITDFIRENWIYPAVLSAVILGLAGAYTSTKYIRNKLHERKASVKTEQVYVPPKPQRVIPPQPQTLKAYTGMFGFDLYVSNEDGSGERQVLDTKNGLERAIDMHPLANPDKNSLYLTIWKPQLSPDQQHIAFVGYDSKKDNYGLYVLDTSGSNLFLLWKRQKGELINATNIKKFDWVNNNSVDIFTGAQFGGIANKTTVGFNHTR